MKVTKDTPKGTLVEIQRGPFKDRVGAIIHIHENHCYVSDMTFGMTFPYADLRIAPVPTEVLPRLEREDIHYRGLHHESRLYVYGYYCPGVIVDDKGEHHTIVPGSQRLYSGFTCERTGYYIYVGDTVDSWYEMEGTDDDGKTWFKTGKVVRKKNQVVEFKDGAFWAGSLMKGCKFELNEKCY